MVEQIVGYQWPQLPPVDHRYTWLWQDTYRESLFGRCEEFAW